MGREGYVGGTRREIATERTQDSKTFLNPDGSHTYMFGAHLHYRGDDAHWKNVDLNFHSSGTEQIADQNDVIVRVDAHGLAVSDRISREGIEWLTPGRPAVLGNAASFVSQGVRWSYLNRVDGVKLVGGINSPRGPRTYAFPYILLGSSALRLDAAGNLIGDRFMVPRAVVIGADHREYPASVWRFIKPHVIGFDFDDSRLPMKAFPYLIDPTTTFSVTSGLDDASVCGNSSSYPPTAATPQTFDSGLISAQRSFTTRSNPANNTFDVCNTLLRWNTSSLSGLTPLSAYLEIASECSHSDDKRDLTADWYSGPIDYTGWTATSQTSALVGAPLSSIGGACGSIVDTTIPLDNVNGVSTSGYTGLRLHVDGAQPANQNFLQFESFESGIQPIPRLLVTTAGGDTAPHAPTLLQPQDGAIVSSTTPTLSTNSAADPDGDPVWYVFSITDSGSSGNSVQSGRILSSSWSPPPGSLQNGGVYSWSAAAVDAAGNQSWSAQRSFSVDVGVGERSWHRYDKLGPVSVDLTNGNLMLGASSSQASSLGGNIGVSLVYNSLQGTEKGLTGSYYNDLNSSHTFDPSYQPSVIRQDPQVAFNWTTASPFASMQANEFLASWSGYVTVPTTGTYSFGSRASDGTRVWINNSLVFDHWVTQTAPTSPQYGAGVSLSAGQTVPIQIQYYDGTDAPIMELWAHGPFGANNALTDATVPASWLSIDRPSLPDGWTFSTDVSGSLSYTTAKITNKSVAVLDASGATHTFKWSSTGWLPPPGEQSVLTTDASTGLLTLQGEDGIIYSFNANGSLAKAVSAVDDTNPAAPVNTWTGVPALLTRITDPVSGHSSTLTYGRDGSCPSAPGFSAVPADMACRIDGSAFGLGETDLYYSNGHLARIVNPGGETTDLGYDANGLLTQIRDPLTNDLITAGTITDPAATTHQTLITYANGNVTQVTLPEPDATGSLRPQHSYEYPSNTTTKVHIAGLTEPNGYARQITFDSLGRVTADTDVAGATTTYEYGVPNSNEVTLTTDPASNMISTVYDADGQPTDTYGPGYGWVNSGGEFTLNYPHTSTSAPHSTVGYDETINGLAAMWWNNPNLAGVPQAHTTMSAWPNWGAASPAAGISSTGFSGRITGDITIPVSCVNCTFSATTGISDGVRLYLDDYDLVFSRWSGSGSLSGNVSLTPGVHHLRIDYNHPSGLANLTVSWTLPSQNSSPIPMTNLRPAYGLVTSKTDADGHKLSVEYTNPENALATATVLDPAGLSLRSTISYEPLGTGYLRPLAYTLPKGPSSTIGRTYWGANETATNPCDSSSPAISQAGLLKLTAAAAPATGQPIQHELRYDAAGRIIAQRVVGDTNWTCTTYDARGRITSHTDAAGKTTAYSYATPGDVTTSYLDSSGSSETTRSHADWLGRTLTYTDEQATTTRSAYDQVGRVTDTYVTFNWSGEAQLTHNTYDSNGHLSQLSEYTSGTASPINYFYDSAERIHQIQRSPLATTYSYDPGRGWINSTQNIIGNGTPFAQWTYSRNPSGKIAAETADGLTRSFIYDGAGRLTQTTEGSTIRNYTYDANSNRCSTSTSCDSSYVYDNADRLISSPFATSYNYDTHGNLTSSNPLPGVVNQSIPGQVPTPVSKEIITYDGNDHATSIDDGTYITNETLAPSGRVLFRSVTDAKTGTLNYGNAFYSYSGEGDSPAYSYDQPTGTHVTAYINGPGGLLVITTGGVKTYPVTNAHGDVVGVVAGGKYTANAIPDEFGVGNPPANRLGWLGSKERFSTGGNLNLFRMGLRLYDPRLGRFLEVDPVPGGSLNDYDYVGQDPVNSQDLSGRMKADDDSHGDQRCADLAKEIGRRVRRIANRLNGLRNDYDNIREKGIWNWRHRVDNPFGGQNSILGHIQQIRQDKKVLAELLQQYRDCGCGDAQDSWVGALAGWRLTVVLEPEGQVIFREDF